MKFLTTSRISENIHETPEGYLVCMGVAIARAGEMEYGPGESPIDVGPDGKARITRDAKELFRPETMASFEGKSFTIRHPAEWVDTSNWSQLTKGILQNVRRGTGAQENDLVADILITEARAIELVKGGLREVSCGYEALYTQTGVGRGFQTQIIGNHLALVEEGRAGSSYAINDHKGKGSKMKLSDRIKAIFAKAQDEAIKIAEEDTGKEKDGCGGEDDEAAAKGAKTLDAAMKAIGELNKKLDGITASLVVKKKAKSKDCMGDVKDEAIVPGMAAVGGAEAPLTLEQRMEKLEATVAAFIASKEEKKDDVTDADEGEEEAEEVEDADDDESGEEEVKDADGDDDEESEEVEDADEDDEEEKGKKKTGDAALTDDVVSRVEILAPGLKAGKNVKAKALAVAFATKDGKAIITRLAGGKTPDFKNPTMVEMLFVGASEVLKGTRTADLARTKTRDLGSFDDAPQGAMTAEKINELNDKRYPKGH